MSYWDEGGRMALNCRATRRSEKKPTLQAQRGCIGVPDAYRTAKYVLYMKSGSSLQSGKTLQEREL